MKVCKKRRIYSQNQELLLLEAVLQPRAALENKADPFLLCKTIHWEISFSNKQNESLTSKVPPR